MLTFSFMETFFFLSLGITFVLILLLIYHFKQRITKTEEKVDMLFDIVQNLVKEVTEHRSEITNIMNRPSIISSNYPFMTSSQTMNMVHDNTENDIIIHDLGENDIIQNFDDVINITCDDDEDDEDDDDDGDDDGDEDEDDDGDEDEDGDGDGDGDGDDENLENYPIILQDLEPIINLEESDFIKIKIEDDVIEETTMDVVSEECLHDEIIENTEVIQYQISDIPSIMDQKHDMEYYKKLSLTALKQEVLSKGLAKDVSKLKKHELLQLMTC
jgi:hypothetical protein